MGQFLPKLRAIDVICNFTKEGEIIPLRIRVIDEDGMPQVFTIKEYKDCSHHGARTMPDGVYVDDRTLIFECRIVVFDRLRMIRLYLEPDQLIWRMSG